MTEADFWKVICGTRIALTATPIVDDPWCRRLLYEAATGSVKKDGSDELTWSFADDSSLIATRQGVTVKVAAT